jgi:hypothetical protein
LYESGTVTAFQQGGSGQGPLVAPKSKVKAAGRVRGIKEEAIFSVGEFFEFGPGIGVTQKPMDKGGIPGHTAEVHLSFLQKGLDGIAKDGYRSVAAEIEVEEIPAEKQHKHD